MKEISRRKFSTRAVRHLADRGFSASLARIFAARGVTDIKQLDTSFGELLPFSTMRGIEAMASLLADAIAARKKIMVIADYDADGATACAVAVRALRAFGAVVDFIVPNRFKLGYGLSRDMVHIAAKSGPEILITVDNGIASIEGVSEANRLGMQVFITDHHLPGCALPDAACIVNPNQPDCHFPSKNLAGVGVIFYVMLALRSELRMRKVFSAQDEPKLADLLDLVALGTVADVVRLDQNNRILVQQGLQRIGAGKCCVGIRAILQTAKKPLARISSRDLAFSIGPRLNAAGRLDDMSLGIECLLTDDMASAMSMAAKLDTLNQQRRIIESDMQNSAEAILDTIDPSAQFSMALFDESWHQGVIGILASRLKDKFHRPTIAFARADNGELRGSGRSISELHLRDTLDLISKRHPSLISKFGGHSAAAGLTLSEGNFPFFSKAFESACRESLSTSDLEQRVDTDGPLGPAELTLEMAHLLDRQVWGHAFPHPTFDNIFIVKQQQVIGEKHLKVVLCRIDLQEGDNVGSGNSAEDSVLSDAGTTLQELVLRCEQPSDNFGSSDRSHDAGTASNVQGILFGYNEHLPQIIRAVYSLSINEYNGRETLQLVIHHWQHVLGQDGEIPSAQEKTVHY
jgi:single-stranded-DNA-specific exonuclease